jgi:hypothetical protein
MTPPKPPVQDLDIPFENGITLATTINPLTRRHSIQCDLCVVTLCKSGKSSAVKCNQLNAEKWEFSQVS